MVQEQSLRFNRGECEFPLVTFKSYFGVYSYSSAFSKWLIGNIKEFDVVVIHGVWQYHSYVTAKVCKKNNIPYVVFTHGMLDPWFNESHLLKTLKKKVYWSMFERHVVNNASKVLFTSEEEMKLARIPFSPYSPAECVVAYGCSKPDIDIERANEEFLCNFGSLSNRKFALFLSRIHEKKGIDLLIEALGQLKNSSGDFMLAIAGPDSHGLQEKLIKQVERLGLVDRVVWLGMLSGNVKWGAYHAADVFVLPSHQENFGIVVAEALCTGTPVLITQKVNIWREIQVAGAGLVENDDVAGIKALLWAWLSMSDADKEKMNSNAKACYENNFSIRSAVNDLENVLLRIKGRC